MIMRRNAAATLIYLVGILIGIYKTRDISLYVPQNTLGSAEQTTLSEHGVSKASIESEYSQLSVLLEI